ncbi:MAG: YkgJ family cysteine cluster protein, partial [Promethearchaeota archaeon]
MMAQSLSTFKFSCTKCGLCCSYPGLIVNLTPRDLRMIKKALKIGTKDLLKVIGFYQVDSIDEEALKQVEARMVLPSLKTSRGRAYVGLLKGKSGHCVFLQHDKCMIYSARPRICNAFPYTFNKRGGDDGRGGTSISITAFAVGLCPGIGKGKLANPRKIKELGRTVLKDMEEFVKFARWWNDRKEEDADAWNPVRL